MSAVKVLMKRRRSSGARGMARISAAGSLVGLEPPSAGRNLEIKSYGIGGLRPDRGWDLRNRGLVVKFNKLFRV